MMEMVITLGFILAILYWLSRCSHEWSEYASGNTLDRHTGRPNGIYVVYQCNHCGKLKREES